MYDATDYSIQDLSFSSIASQIRASQEGREELSRPRITYLLVEGDSDQKCFRSFVDKERCILQMVNGSKKHREAARGRVIGALNLLNYWGCGGCVGVIDADMAHYNGTPPSTVNVYLTDTHDLETMIARSPALERVLDHLADHRKVQAFERKRGQSIRECLLDAATTIGFLRWINDRDRLSLKFSDIEYTFFTDETSLQVDLSKLVDHVVLNSQYFRGDAEALKTELRELLTEGADPWQIVQGHDMLALLAIGLREIFGASYARNQVGLGPHPHNRYQIASATLGGYVGVAYAMEYFRETRLYESLRNWESENAPYVIFAA